MTGGRDLAKALLGDEFTATLRLMRRAAVLDPRQRMHDRVKRTEAYARIRRLDLPSLGSGR